MSTCVREVLPGGGRAGSSKEGVLEQGEVETFLPLGDAPGGVRRQNCR